MPKRKKRTVSKKKKDDSPDEVSECESLDRPPSAKKVAAASSTSHLDDEMDHISTFSSVSLHSTTASDRGENSAILLCNYCSFTADTKAILGAHIRQHMIKCPHCSFSSLSRIEVSRHCKYEHEKDIDAVPPEVDSSSTECEMDKDPCSACVFCSFMTYSTEHLEKHTMHKHPGLLAKSVAKMITKKISAELHKEDYFFYLTISNEGLTKPASALGNSSSVSEKPSDPIVIDVSLDKAEDVKPEVTDNVDTKPVQHKFLDPVKMNLNCGSLSDALPFGEKIENRDVPKKVESSSSLAVPVKVETMYCLTCPYSNVYIEKLKCHTIVQHPVGAAAATCSSTGESVDVQDTVFFCVREDCSHNSSDCSTYQKHLIDCCACQKTLKVLERERLRSTITYILEHQRKFKLTPEEGFFDFASPFLGFSLPPSLTGLSSARGIETPPGHSAKTERSINSPQSLATNTVETPSESSPLATHNYKVQNSMLNPPALPSSSSESAGNHPSNVNQSYFHQRLQNFVPNIPLADTMHSGQYQSRHVNSSGSIGQPISSNSIILPADGRTPQPNQSQNAHVSTTFDAQNQRDFTQPSTVTQINYQDTPQNNICWPSDKTEPSLLSAPVHSPENFRMNYHDQHPDEHPDVSAGLTSQDNAACNSSVSQSRANSFSLAPNVEMNQNFTSIPAHNNYTPVSRHMSLDSGSSTHVNANMAHTINIQPHDVPANSVSNPMASLAFYEQQQIVSSVEAQPQPKMLDLLSDSYSILLSDEFGPQGELQEPNNLIQPQQNSCCPPPAPYHQLTAFNSQSQAVVSQSSLMSQGHSTVYQPMQQEESSLLHQHPLVDNSVMLSCENQFSFPLANQGDHLENVMPDMAADSGFQAAHSSSNYGAVQSMMPPETSSCVQPVPLQSPNVPNFLVAPSMPSSEMVTVQQHATSSFLNHRPSMMPAAAPPAPCTPPKNTNTVNRFAGASPLSPSIYLSGQSPRHKRSSWTDADMRPRGMMLSGTPPRNTLAPPMVTGQQSHVNPRMISPGRRGYPRIPRMPPGRGRMPAPRMPNNKFSRVEDDDDVILTAVTRVTTPMNQQPRQPSSVRFAGSGNPRSMSPGRGQGLPVQNRQRGHVPGVRMPYTTAVPPLQPPKQFDISKHFEDLACVVNASAEEGEGGNDNDIEIICVTPGDKDKANQPRAVDANKFSFCCVHCGKDQGSKSVMKQHMKARHNDSLLGAFTNTETGQLLFFCPQLTCEFMTYDEKRLCEHLSKCYDLDRSKPFDFGTAIKNLKSLKIRQLDVRTMGRSQDNPIDLDGQGMKDNFSSSLNDAFGDIVVSASGRHIMRNTTPPHQAPISQLRPQFMSNNSGSPRNKVPFRNQAPGSLGPRQRLPSFTERTGGANRMIRPMTTFRSPQQQNSALRPKTRQTAPSTMRMNLQNVREMHPRVPTSGEHHQPQSPRGPPSHFAATPTKVSTGDQQVPVVIVIDADSPERPEEIEQNYSLQNDRSEISNQNPVSMSESVLSDNLRAKPPQYIMMSSPARNAIGTLEQCSTSADQNFVFNQPVSASSEWNSTSNASRDPSPMTPVQSFTVISQPVPHSYETMAENIPYDSEVGSSDVQWQQNSVSTSHEVASSPASLNFCQEDINVSKSTTLNSSSFVSSNTSFERIGKNTAADLNSNALVSTYTAADSHITNWSTSGGSDIPTSPSAPNSSVSSLSSGNTLPMMDFVDEEEKVNAVVLEKVFAKVPNMPKNLSRRLVAKFKQYAHYRGVKITSDSKVIDEFVSKIYYKGSTADKNANKAQLTPHASSYSDGNCEDSPVESVVPSKAHGNSVAKEAETECESARQLTNQQDVTMHEGTSVKETEGKQQVVSDNSSVVDEDSSMQTSENDVITTQVILAQTNLQFSPTFATLALKTLTTSKLLGSKQGLRHNLATEVLEKNFSSSLESNSIGDTSAVTRRNSASDAQMSKVIHPFRRSSSFPLHVPRIESPEIVKLPVEDCSKLEMAASSPCSAINMSLDNKPLLVPVEVCTPSESALPLENVPLLSKDDLKEDSEIAFPAVPTSDIIPILITSSVEDVVARHPSLEVDIAGTPCKQEELDECNKELENVDLNTSKDVHDDINEIPPKKERKKFGKVSSFYDIIDKTTGKLLLKKTKRGKPRKLFNSVEEKQDESKDPMGEEHAVRRSSRSRKPVNKNYQNDVNEMDELLSDDDDEYNIDDETGSDTDNEWNKGNTEQPPKKKIKKVIPPPDPTAFEFSTKGKFKCWLCKKIFSRCSFAKSHITQKHDAGLCTIYLDKSEELKSLCLLVFCPRKCRYVTQSLEGIKSHMESCTQSLFENGEKYLEINKQFLENTYSELQSLSLEEMLKKTKIRKQKDPTKALKVKKTKSKVDKSAVGPMITSHDNVLRADEVDSVSFVTPSGCTPSSSCVAAGPSALNLTTSSIRASLPEDRLNQIPQPKISTELEKSATSKKFSSHPPHKPPQYIRSQVPSQHGTNVAPDRSNPHYSHMTSSATISTARSHTSCPTPVRQQMFTSTKQAQPSSSFSPHPTMPHVPNTSSSMHDDEVVYVVEDNGTICLK